MSGTSNPLEKNTFSAIAYNAVGRAAEVNNKPAYALSHSIGNSGWSVGFLQWDFGQSQERHAEVDVLLQKYQTWAPGNAHQQFSQKDVASLSRRLKTPGHSGNSLSNIELNNLDDFLKSDDGRSFVSSLDQRQMERKWENVGKPLSEIPWLKERAKTDPEDVAKIVAVTSKLFNQNEVRGGRLIQKLETEKLTSEKVVSWIGHEGINGLNPSARSAILTGRDNALAGISLVNSLEKGVDPISKAWRHQVHELGNYSLSANFSTDPSVQALDKMFRDPVNGQKILLHLNPKSAEVQVKMPPTSETARVELTKDHVLHVESPDKTKHELKEDGWHVVPPSVTRRQVSQADEGIANQPLSESALLAQHSNPVVADFHERVQNEPTMAGYSETERSRVAAAACVECQKMGKNLAGMTEVESYDANGRAVFTADDPVKAARNPYTSSETVDIAKAVETPVQDSLNQMQTIQMTQAQAQEQAQTRVASGPVIS